MLGMYKGKRIGAILLMGGRGERFQSDIPKQFHSLGGKKIYEHTLDVLKNTELFDEIVLVCPSDWPVEPGQVVCGGKTRQESSYLGLNGFQKKIDIVLIHDAVRPFLTETICKENIELAIEFGAADTCIPSADTLVYAPNGVIESIPNRAHFLRGQTPQTFQMDLILKAHKTALEDGIENASDDCQLVLRLGMDVAVAKGSERNMKITSELDLALAENILERV